MTTSFVLGVERRTLLGERRAGSWAIEIGIFGALEASVTDEEAVLDAVKEVSSAVRPPPTFGGAVVAFAECVPGDSSGGSVTRVGLFLALNMMSLGSFCCGCKMGDKKLLS